ncbi:hypothetical protein KSP40_PGU002292 [Platanthera guangdongensis]|uniref:Uncharacterized protein n=1 Tax=Platanthera guangdongensis TaxID=2320717 RepID=A0ABR2M198_9ASPA
MEDKNANDSCSVRLFEIYRQKGRKMDNEKEMHGRKSEARLTSQLVNRRKGGPVHKASPLSEGPVKGTNCKWLLPELEPVTSRSHGNTSADLFCGGALISLFVEDLKYLLQQNGLSSSPSWPLHLSSSVGNYCLLSIPASLCRELPSGSQLKPVLLLPMKQRATVSPATSDNMVLALCGICPLAVGETIPEVVSWEIFQV